MKAQSSLGKQRSHNRIQNRKSATKPKRRIGPLHVWRWILGIATLIGGFAAFVTFLPRIAVSASDPVDPPNPFSASFVIKNANIIPLEDVVVSLGIGQIEGLDAQELRNFIPSFASRVSKPEWEDQKHLLPMDGTFTMTPGDVFKPPISFADIAIVVTYKPWFMPFHREKLFRFVTHKQSNGNLYWYSQTLGLPSN